MKKDVHPTYFPKAAVACACGAKYQIGSTLEKIEVEICSACHPFFTGTEKVLDTAGRVERFKTRKSKAVAKPKKVKVLKPKKTDTKTDTKTDA